MISSEVQRTLVKSPPELWAELSDPTSLARHLGELGEIKITRVEPEKTVEWEAADTTGKVLLKSSGWGTKVTLSATREAVPPVTAPIIAAEPAIEAVESTAPDEPAGAEEPVAETSLQMAPESEPAAVAEAVAEAQPVIQAARVVEAEVVEEPKPEPAVGESKPRPGFFARLFRRRAKAQAAPEAPADEPPVEPAPAIEPEPELAAKPEPEPATEPEPRPENAAAPVDEPAEYTPDIAAELKTAEEVAAEEVTAVLTAVLDRLGAAHHRPFSRS
jgi:hypothetical protein